MRLLVPLSARDEEQGKKDKALMPADLAAYKEVPEDVHTGIILSLLMSSSISNKVFFCSSVR
jgi:hypothetical protein